MEMQGALTVFLLSVFAVVSKAQVNSYKRASIYTTAKGEAPLSKVVAGPFSTVNQPLETSAYVFVDPTKTFQTLLGIGGAITDAAAETFAKLSNDKQEELLTAYYDAEKGIGYSLARTNINSCDFSSGSYTYVNESDEELRSFSIKHDLQYKIPLIKAAFNKTGGNLTLFASPWSPPAWMKSNNSMLKGGKLKPEYYQSWANYFMRFINEYEKNGVQVWGLSVQNEPMAVQTWESCEYTAEEERDFVKNYLGPTLHKNKLGDKKLIIWDHNRDLIFQRAATVLNDPEAAKYVWGVGYHWYETWTGNAMQFNNGQKVADSFRDKNLLFTEGCVEKFSLDRVSDWALGEKYGHSIINDFNAGTCGWTDWNILLDETGGPNHVGNFCFAPVHADIKRGELIFTNAYYYLGHFSKFIRPGTKRIVSSANRDKLQNTAFLNKDGSIAVVVMNSSEDELKYQVWLDGKACETVSKPHSIATIIINR